jgi:hypothetical protein
MDIRTILGAALVLLSLLIFVVLAGWIIGAVLGYIIKWLLERKQVRRLGEFIRQGGQSWWSRHEAGFERLSEVLWEMVIDPLFFAFMVYLLFNRITSIKDYSAAHPGTNFWSQLGLDVEHNMNFYMVFLIVFYVWMLGKALVHRRQVTEQRAIKKMLEANTKAIEANTKVSEAIARQMGISESEYKVTDTKPDIELDQCKDV